MERLPVVEGFTSGDCIPGSGFRACFQLLIRKADGLEWSYIAPAAQIEPGERTGEYRTADGQLVATDDGESSISMEDFAIAFADELENNEAVHT